MITVKPKDIDAYIAAFPKSTQLALKQIRAAIIKAAPGAEEKISYGMPAFRLNKANLVYFAGYEKHIGLYPAPVSMEAFKNEMVAYKTGKGSVQFPLDKPMPLNLITRIVKFRARETSAKAKAKKSTGKK